MPIVAVIDDEPMICDLVEDSLRHAGSEVYRAHSAETAVALLTSRYFDLALIDVLLQDQSGILVAEIAANQNTPVVLMTGHDTTAMRLRQFDFPHMLKPFKVSQLTDAVATVMTDRHRNIRHLTDSLARMHANLAGLELETAKTIHLIAKTRQLLSRSGNSGPEPRNGRATC